MSFERDKLSNHLFRLSEYRRAFENFFHVTINALMKAKSPVLDQIQSETKEHVPTYQLTTTAGETVEFETIKSEMKIA